MKRLNKIVGVFNKTRDQLSNLISILEKEDSTKYNMITKLQTERDLIMSEQKQATHVLGQIKNILGEE